MGKLAFMNTLVGKRIKRRRRADRLTQQQVANAVGVSRVAVSKWERGDTQNLRHAHLKALSRLLGITIEDLLASTPNSARLGDAPAPTMDTGPSHAKPADDRWNALLYHYQQLTDEQRDALFRLIELMSHSH